MAQAEAAEGERKSRLEASMMIVDVRPSSSRHKTRQMLLNRFSKTKRCMKNHWRIQAWNGIGYTYSLDHREASMESCSILSVLTVLG